MKNAAGYFWLKFSSRVGVSGGASTAHVESAQEKLQYGDVKGGQFIEGMTIRLRAQMGMEQTVVSFNLIAPLGNAEAMPLSFYVDTTDPKKPAKRFDTGDDALGEQKKPEYVTWASDGVVVLVSLGIAQA